MNFEVLVHFNLCAPSAFLCGEFLFGPSTAESQRNAEGAQRRIVKQNQYNFCQSKNEPGNYSLNCKRLAMGRVTSSSSGKRTGSAREVSEY